MRIARINIMRGSVATAIIFEKAVRVGFWIWFARARVRVFRGMGDIGSLII